MFSSCIRTKATAHSFLCKEVFIRKELESARNNPLD